MKNNPQHGECIGPPGSHNAGFTLIEFIVAMGILAVVISAFSVSLRGLITVEQRFTQETESIVVLNNVLERLEHEKVWDADTAGRILEQEFGKSDLSRESSLHPGVYTEAGTVRAAVVGKNQKSMAAVELRK